MVWALFGGGDVGSRGTRRPGISPVVSWYRTDSANGHVAQRPDGIVGVAADVLGREVAGHVDDQRAGKLHDVWSSLLGSAEGVERFGEDAKALPERDLGDHAVGWRCCFAGAGCFGGGG